MLCQIGLLVLLSSRQVEYARVLERVRAQPQLDLEQVETEILGASHCDVGAYLLGLWGLPNPIVEAVAYHRRPSRTMLATAGPVTYVHAALAIQRGFESQIAEAQLLDAEYLGRLELLPRVDAWRELCRSAVAEAA
jgi:HD-like signal output (HDOD) protein